MNPAEWLVRSACRSPAAPALLHGTELVADYATFNQQAASIGAALGARGVAEGDAVAVFMPNDPRYLPILYGIWYAGAVAVPVNAKLHAREAGWIIGHSGAAHVFTAEADALAAAGDIDASVALHDIGAGACEEMVRTPPLPAPVQMIADDAAWIFYTSGTTGRPKGAVLSAGNLMAMSLSYFADVDEVAPADAALYAAPISHGAGLYNFVHVLRGARHVVPKSGGFDPAEVLDLAEVLSDVSLFAAPTMVKRLTDHGRATGRSGQGLKTVVYGGGPMYVADICEALEVFGPKFVQIYGQGEAPMTITALSRADIADEAHPDWKRRLASVGRAHSVAELKICGTDECALPPGQIGEIAVRGPQVMRGYLNDEAANSATLRDGWLMTGDMGRLDPDGYLSLHDRAKDVVISGGSNIYPREVEEALLWHQGVAEVSVIGVPDAEWGEIVVAFIVPAKGAVPTPVELDTVCLDRIARFKKPKRYIFVEGLPKNNYGKVLKTELRKTVHDAAE